MINSRNIIRSFIIYISIYIFSSFDAMGQKDSLCGTYMPYSFSNISAYDVPNGYSIVLINHLGRHGSRFPVSNYDISPLKQLLQKEKDKQNITSSGEDLLAKLSQFEEECEDRWGLLTPLGSQQEFDLAQRLEKYIPLDSAKKIKVWCDPKERCQESYESFMSGLNQSHSINYSLIDRTLLPILNPLLNFYKTDSAYVEFKESNSWNNYLDVYTQDILKDIDWLNYFLINTTNYTSEDQINFAIHLFSCISISPNIPFSFDDLPVCKSSYMDLLWRIDNAKEYLQKGPSPIANNLQMNIALPLLKNFIQTSEEGISKNEFCAYLRFAHAETLMPFVALLQVPEASAQTDNTEDIYKVWKDFIISPMASNLVWIFYKNNSNRYVVKMLLNEKEVRFPILTDTYPYYNWEDIKTYYLKKITEIEQRLPID